LEPQIIQRLQTKPSLASSSAKPVVQLIKISVLSH